MRPPSSCCRPPVPGVVGVGVGAALEVGRQPVGFERLPGGVGVGEARLATVGPRQPAEVVVEGAVLHHQHDDRVERQVACASGTSTRSRAGRLAEDRVGTEHARPVAIARPPVTAARWRNSRRRMKLRRGRGAASRSAAGGSRSSLGSCQSPPVMLSPTHMRAEVD